MHNTQHLQKELEYAFDLVSKPDNSLIKQGQNQLHKLKSNTNYPMLLLSYLKDSIGYDGKLRASIQLRIWCDNYKVHVSSFRICRNFSATPTSPPSRMSRPIYCLPSLLSMGRFNRLSCQALQLSLLSNSLITGSISSLVLSTTPPKIHKPL